MRRIGAVLLCLAAWAAAAWSADDPLVQARRLALQGQYEKARQILEAELKRDPTSPVLHSNLGYVLELAGKPDEAIEHYAETIRVAPNHPYARERLWRLFYGDRFPTHLRRDQLSLLPVRFSVLTVDTPWARGYEVAVTISLLYPPQMRKTGKPLTVQVPGGRPAEANRVVFCFLARPGDKRMVRVANVYFPSPVLSREGLEYQPVAQSLALLAGRFHAYLDALLPAPSTAIDIYLCEHGKPEAQAGGGAVYFFGAGRMREGTEWLRQLSHELGHLRMPSLGGFTAPESSPAGYFAEGLISACLAWEALRACGQMSGPSVRSWLHALWPLGRVNLEALVRPAAEDLAQWLQVAPYPQPAEGQAAMSLARGLVLWALVACGRQAVPAMLGPRGDATPQALLARLASWLARRDEIRWSLAAALPGGKQWIAALGGPGQPMPAGTKLKLLVYLPPGEWKAAWQPGAEPASFVFRPAATSTALVVQGRLRSRGAWGWLQANLEAPASYIQFVKVKSQAAQ